MPSSYPLSPYPSQIQSSARRRPVSVTTDPSVNAGYPLPSVMMRRARENKGANETGGAFLEWLISFGRVMLMPITLPLNLFLSLLSSPLTLSLLIRLTLLTIVFLISGITSSIVVGGWWWSWAGGGGSGSREVEGWFVYGSKSSPTPHSYITFPTLNTPNYFLPDVEYDLEVEVELVRPRGGGGGGSSWLGMGRRDGYGSGGGWDERGGNFMISVSFLSEKTNQPIMTIAQPCLPALPYVPQSLIYSLIPSIPSFPIPLTLNPLTIMRTLSPFSVTSSSNSLTRIKSSKKFRDTFLLNRPMTYPSGKGVIMRPSGRKAGKGGENVVGGLLVSIGREDGGGGDGRGEVKTMGWVVVRIKPRATGLRWLLTSHPLPPLLILPPIAIFMTLISSLTSYFVITYCFRAVTAGSGSADTNGRKKRVGDGSNGNLFAKESATSPASQLKVSSHQTNRHRNPSATAPTLVLTQASPPEEQLRHEEELNGGLDEDGTIRLDDDEEQDRDGDEEEGSSSVRTGSASASREVTDTEPEETASETD